MDVTFHEEVPYYSLEGKEIQHENSMREILPLFQSSSPSYQGPIGEDTDDQLFQTPEKDNASKAREKQLQVYSRRKEKTKHLSQPGNP